MSDSYATVRMMQRRIVALLVSRMADIDKAPYDIDDACEFRPGTAARDIARMIYGNASRMDMKRLADLFFAVDAELSLTIQPRETTENEPHD